MITRKIYYLKTCNQILHSHLFYSYKNLDEIDEFKDIITSTEFLAKDIYERICNRLKKDFNEDYQTLHKLKITLTESNVAWASFEKEIDK